MLLITSVFCFRLQNDQIEIHAEEKTVNIQDNTQTKSDLIISKKDAKNIAEYQVQNTLEGQDSIWEKNTEVGKTYNLYNENDEVIAYAVDLTNDGEEAGYVVVGANEENSPIIEFKTSGKFLDQPLNEDEHVIYDGYIDYYKVNETTELATNIDNPKEKIEVEKLQNKMKKELPNKEKSNSIKKEWDDMKEQIKYGSSNPPTSGGANTAPWNYESGYTSQEFKTAPDANFYTYFVMSDFGPGGICVPTAACNLLKYYMSRQRMKTSLILNNDWNQTFSRIKTYSKTSDTTGTYMSDAKKGLDKYFCDLNIQDAVTHYYSWGGDNADWEEMKRRIDMGEPFIYATSSHFYYGQHAVLAVGYRQYNYSATQSSGLYSSNYLQVADGWTDHADRYINVNVGNQASTDEMITLYFVYSYIQK